MSRNDKSLTINFKPARSSRLCLIGLWSLLFLITLIYFGFVAPMSNWVVLIGSIIIMAIACWYNLQQINRLYQDYSAICYYQESNQQYSHEKQWFLIKQAVDKTNKIPIEIMASSGLWPLWIKLDFREQNAAETEHKLFSRKSLLILKDAMSEPEFRHLSRTLRFYKQTAQAKD